MIYRTWINQWLVLIAPLRSPRTITGYKSALAHAGKLIDMHVDAVTPIAWQIAVNTVSSKYPRQAQIMHAALRASWRYGQRLGVIPIDSNPWRMVVPPAHIKRDISYLMPEEIASYTRAAMSTQAALPLLLMLFCGLRRGEALGLMWADIEAQQRLLHVKRQMYAGKICRPKSRTSIRIVPLTSEICVYLRKIAQNDNLCYTGSAHTLYRAHAAALKAARIDRHITLHGLRHTFATAAIMGGAPITAVQHILGHAQFATTADIYAHATLSAERAAVELVATGQIMAQIMAECTRLEIA